MAGPAEPAATDDERPFSSTAEPNIRGGLNAEASRGDEG